MSRIKIIVEYEGTNYAGWQIQPNANTIQAEIERAIKNAMGEDVRIHGAGRTDAGVHALGQVAYFDVDSTMPSKQIKLALNAHLPHDIRVKTSVKVSDDFHARFSAQGKIYSYYIHNGPVASAVCYNTTYHVKKELNLAAMQKASTELIGKHDFSAFCAANTEVNDKVRHIESIEITKNDNTLTLTFVGNGFLYNMVRIMIGTLVDAGKGELTQEQIKAILMSKDRTKASATAPAKGLFLKQVIY